MNRGRKRANDRSRRAVAVRWALLLTLLTVNCVAVDRGRSRTTLGVDGQAGSATHKSYGCGGEVLSAQTHSQVGGGVKVRHEGRDGLILGAGARLVRGTPDSYSCQYEDHCEPRRAIDMSPYTLMSGGLTIGFDFESLGTEGGFNVAHLIGGPSRVIPWARLKVGPMKAAWFETTFGPHDPLFVLNLLSLGAGWDTGPVGGRAGVMFYGVLLDDVEDRGDLKLGADSDGFDAGAYFDVVYALPGTQMAMTAGGFVGHSLGARLGLSGVFGE